MKPRSNLCLFVFERLGSEFRGVLFHQMAEVYIGDVYHHRSRLNATCSNFKFPHSYTSNYDKNR